MIKTNKEINREGGGEEESSEGVRKGEQTTERGKRTGSREGRNTHTRIRGNNKHQIATDACIGGPPNGKNTQRSANKKKTRK